MATIPTDDPWVPVRILSLGLDGARPVEADVFLLTDDEPTLLAGGSGLTLERSEEADSLLLDDLRSDVNMEWVPERMWFSYLSLDAPAAELDYDLAVTTEPGVTPSLVDAGVPEGDAIPVLPPADGLPMWPFVLAAVAGVVVLIVVWSRRNPVAGGASFGAAGRGSAGGSPWSS
jgi:hypothetical protein